MLRFCIYNIAIFVRPESYLSFTFKNKSQRENLSSMRTGLYFVLKYISFTVTLRIVHYDTNIYAPFMTV